MVHTVRHMHMSKTDHQWVSVAEAVSRKCGPQTFTEPFETLLGPRLYPQLQSSNPSSSGQETCNNQHSNFSTLVDAI